MTDVPLTANDITYDWLKETVEAALPGSELTAMHVDANVGDLGYLGTIGRINLEYASPNGFPASMIVKFPATDSAVLEQGQQLGAYASEVNFYKHMANKGVGQAPRYYLSVVQPGSGEEVVFIEDLGDLRFVSQTEGAKLNDSLNVMKALAKLHGEHWGSTSLEDTWLGDISDWGRNNMPLMERGLPLFKENFVRYFDKDYAELFDVGVLLYPRVLDRLSAQRCTLMHGDTHIRNVAFDDAREDPVRFYDWQLCCRGPAAYDVLYYMVNSLAPEDQEAWLDQLLETYLDALHEYVPDFDMAELHREMGYCCLTFWGFTAWLGNILPPNEATHALVEASVPRYMNLMNKFDAYHLVNEFRD